MIDYKIEVYCSVLMMKSIIKVKALSSEEALQKAKDTFKSYKILRVVDDQE